MLHSQISVGAKFEHKLAILIIWTKYIQKRYFQNRKIPLFHASMVFTYHIKLFRHNSMLMSLLLLVIEIMKNVDYVAAFTLSISSIKTSAAA